MFLDWSAKLSLLEHNPDSDICGKFSLPVKKIIVGEVVSHLLDKQNGVPLLTSAAHVKWAMEAVGQGFTLPIEEEEIISKVIMLYRNWALEPSKRPAPIQQDPQYFIQRILEQFSLLFTQRQHSPMLAERHAVLCSQVLDIYANIGFQIGKYLTKPTWEIFLKLLISIADSILLNEPPPGLEALQKKLPAQLVKVLFEQFLLSGMQDPHMWNALQSRVKGWTRHMALMMTWKVTCFALTKRTLALIYGANEGSESIIIKIDDTVHTITCEDQFAFYAWQRMLHILGNPNQTITHPAIFLAFMNGVEMLVNQYLKIGMSNKKKRIRNLPPDGNTIFHVFGQWLFEAIQFGPEQFDEGTALALKILCNIVTTKYRTDYLPTYLARLCVTMQSALLKEGRLLIAAINHGSALLPFEIRGIRSLIPAFVYAIHRILTKRVQNYDFISPTDVVRRNCLKILSQIICLANHFGNGEFKLRIRDKNARPFDTANYYELKPHISNLLIEALTNETCPKNIETLLYLTFTWLCEDIEFNSADYLKQVLTLIVRKITSHVAWPTEVTLVALRMLSSISRLWGKFNIGTEQANFVVVNLCKYVSSQSVPASRFPGKDTKDIEELVAQSFQCICDWVLVDQWIFTYAETRDDLLTAIVIGLTGKKQSAPQPVIDQAERDKKDVASSKKHKKGVPEPKAKVEVSPVSEKIRDAAMYVLLTVLNHMGNFPSASGPATVSTLVVEADILADIAAYDGTDINEARQYMRYFITEDKVVIGVIDRPGLPEHGGPSTTIIVRDLTGKYAWDATLSYLPHSEQYIQHEEFCPPPVPVSKDPFRSSVKSVEREILSDVYGYFSTQATSGCFDITSVQVENEEKYLRNQSYHLNSDITAVSPQPSKPYAGACKLQQSRMLLSHLGYLSLENRGRLYPVNMTKEFFNALKLLDQVPERECIKVGVLYVRKGQKEETDWYGNEGGTLDYQEFLSSLGWGINIATHNGFIAGLDRKLSTGNVAPYWSDYATEVIFLASTLMPNSDKAPDHSHKKQQISNVYVIIVWAEPGTDYQPALLWKTSKKNAVQIVITPMECGLYMIRIHSNKGERIGVGPLADGMMLSKHTLGVLIRECAMQAYRMEKLANEGPVSQFQLRQQFIDDLFYKYKRETTLEEFYASLFTQLPEGQAVGIASSSVPTPLVRKLSRAASHTPSSAKKQPFGKLPSSSSVNEPGTPGPSISPAQGSPQTPPLGSSGGNSNGAAVPSVSGGSSSSSLVDSKGAFGRVAPRPARPSGPVSGLRMGIRGNTGQSSKRGAEDDE